MSGKKNDILTIFLKVPNDMNLAGFHKEGVLSATPEEDLWLAKNMVQVEKMNGFI